MRRTTSPLPWLALLLPLAVAPDVISTPAGAQAVAGPALLNYQGRLAKPDGTPVPDGSYSIRFSLYNAVSAGTKRWEQTIDPVVVRNGTFAVLLNVGANFQNGATAATLFNENLSLEIKIGADTALTPRQPLVSVAYALKANTVPDGSLTAAKFAGGVLSPSGAAGSDLTGTYPNPELRTLTSSLFKVSGTLMSALQGGVGGVNQAQDAVTAQNQDEAWQSFTPSQTGSLTAIELYIGTTGGQNKTIPLTIYAGEGTTGSVLRQVTIVVTPAMGFQNFAVSPPVALTSGQKYTYYVGRSSSLQFGYSDNNPYAGGIADLNGGLDYAFRTYMNTGANGRVGVNGDFTVSGKAGFGTVTPGMSLEVTLPSYYGGPALGVANGDRHLYLHGGATDPSFIWSNNSALRFGTETARGTGYAERMRLTPEGKLGIGTDNPLDPLTVAGTGTAISTIDGPVRTRLFSANSAGRGYLGTFSNHGLVLRTADADRMIITSGGNVGIGDFNPASRLSVTGNAAITGNLSVSGANVLQLGAGVAGQEGSAGKIGYQTFTADALDIVGAGTTGANRKVKIWAEGGATFTGPITAVGAVIHGNVVSLGNFGADSSIGAAVDATSTILINQTTAFRSLSLPNPSNTTAGRMVRIVNTGSAKFQVQSAALIPPGRAVSFLWTGVTWIPDATQKRVLTGTVNVGDVGGAVGNRVVTGDFASATQTQLNDSNSQTTVNLGWSLSNYLVIITIRTTSDTNDGYERTNDLRPPVTGNHAASSFQIRWEETNASAQTTLAQIMVIEL